MNTSCAQKVSSISSRCTLTLLLILAAITVVSANNINTTTNQPFACFEHFTGRSYPVCPQYYGPTNCTDKFECFKYCRYCDMIVVGVIVMWDRSIAQRDIIHVMYKLILICRHHNQSKIEVLVYDYVSASTKSEYPKPLSCDSDFGVWRTHAVYKDSSCCSDDGIYFVETGQSGGFDFSYESADGDPWCSFYAHEMSGLVCDPNQGRYVTDNTLKICESSCRLLFGACGLPGINFPSWTKYNDAISLCEQSWGGFSSSIDGMEDEGPCNSRPDGFACKSGIYKVEVVPDEGEEGDANCLGFDLSPTTQQFIDQHDPYYTDYTCDDGPNNTVIIIGSIVGCLVLVALICFGLLVIRSKRNQNLVVEEQPITEHVIAATTAKQEQLGVVVEDVSTLHSSTSIQADSSIPIVVADSIVPLTSASAPPLENNNSASPENKSSEHQRMNLREIEGNLQLGVITQQEFDSMRIKILAADSD